MFTISLNSFGHKDIDLQSFWLGVMDKSAIVTAILREWQESKDLTQPGATGTMARVSKETTVGRSAAKTLNSLSR